MCVQGYVGLENASFGTVSGAVEMRAMRVQVCSGLRGLWLTSKFTLDRMCRTPTKAKGYNLVGT